MSASRSTSSGPLIIAGLVILLLVLHQDNWFWESKTLVLGFIPIGLFWHACISVAASATWFLATKIAWPLDEATTEQSRGNLPPLNHLAEQAGENADQHGETV